MFIVQNEWHPFMLYNFEYYIYSLWYSIGESNPYLQNENLLS